MFFLVEYDRQNETIVSFEAFDETRQHEAEESRLALELSLQRQNTDHEVVLLEAADEAALRKTHRRYFETMESLLKSGF
ncbi:MAG: hypothetical protein HUU46_24315 [Candidatus Hydrogenedentes bacterium]|nr:hypothetical protein [Candidatus Hydrogenedentota bacterium]